MLPQERSCCSSKKLLDKQRAVELHLAAVSGGSPRNVQASAKVYRLPGPTWLLIMAVVDKACLRGLFDKDDDDVHPLVDNSIFKACPTSGMRFDTKEVRTTMLVYTVRCSQICRKTWPLLPATAAAFSISLCPIKRMSSYRGTIVSYRRQFKLTQCTLPTECCCIIPGTRYPGNW